MAVEIDGGALMVAAAGAMASALATLIFCRLAFRVSLEARLKDLEHRMERLVDLEEAIPAAEERIGDLEMEAVWPEAQDGEGATEADER
ncbi:hypothetical protein [Candidatus Methanocrinis natronophilus]|uniref:hypothetical protein n=1 Tax=Candidatus Methanocrinis natronophilus TaxID=3033396 RepID=UPI0029346A30|nr:hypothetical protein [Candidatus Methanocrinis natronophilus]